MNPVTGHVFKAGVVEVFMSRRGGRVSRVDALFVAIRRAWSTGLILSRDPCVGYARSTVYQAWARVGRDMPALDIPVPRDPATLVVSMATYPIIKLNTKKARKMRRAVRRAFSDASRS